MRRTATTASAKDEHVSAMAAGSPAASNFHPVSPRASKKGLHNVLSKELCRFTDKFASLLTSLDWGRRRLPVLGTKQVNRASLVYIVQVEPELAGLWPNRSDRTHTRQMLSMPVLAYQDTRIDS